MVGALGARDDVTFRDAKAPRQESSRGRRKLKDWGGWIRTTDLLINSQALCQLSYTPKTRLTRESCNFTGV